jgi:hypothetical protein
VKLEISLGIGALQVDSEEIGGVYWKWVSLNFSIWGKPGERKKTSEHNRFK